MSKCRLYAWGANSHGQLGLGFQSEQSTLPQEVEVSSLDLDPRDVVKIVGGAGHTLLLDRRGRVYSCGWNSKGQAGRPADEEVRQFRRVDGFVDERVLDVVCGWDGSMALTENGRVFVWGSNFYGQLGIAGDVKSLRVPEEIIGIDERIRKIAMGLRHSAIITESGRLLVAGAGSKFQLGVLDEDGKIVPRLSRFTPVPGVENVAAVACGQNHTVVVKRTGEFYSWGDNKHGQLGVDSGKLGKIGSPRKLETTRAEEIGELRAGWTHTSFLSADEGRIFSWGRNTYGQLGYREDEKNATWLPKCVPIGARIRQFSVGSEHNVALTEDGEVFSWGWNEHGNCGNGSTRDVLTPERVKFPRATKGILVGCGAGHSFAIVTDNDKV